MSQANTIKAVVLCSLAGLVNSGCRDPIEAPWHQGPTHAALAVAAPSDDCTGCIYGPTTVHRGDSLSTTVSATFTAASTQPNVLLISRASTAMTHAKVAINGTIVQLPDSLPPDPLGVQVVLVAGANQISVTVAGDHGASVTIRVLGSAQVVDGRGGSINSTNVGVIVGPGVLVRPSVLQVSDLALPAQSGIMLSNGAGLIVLPLTNLGTSNSVQVEIPLAALPFSGGAAYAHLRIEGAPEDFWALLSVDPSGTASFALSASDLKEIGNALGIRALTMTAWAEAYPAFSYTPPLGTGLTMRVAAPQAAGPPACIPLPSPFLPSHVSCGVTPLRLQTPGVVSDTMIVLVHGWMNQEGNFFDYYKDQGLTCSVVQNLPMSCGNRVLTLGPTLPGEVYFKHLLSYLTHDLPRSPIAVFDFESYNHIQTNGDGLFDELASRFLTRNGRARFVLVSHSMGGLVSRVATAEAESNFSYPRDTLVLANLTLGTPHLGTPGPLVPLATHLLSGVPTPGGQDLITGLPVRTERAPLYTFGGVANRNGIPFSAVPIHFGWNRLTGYLKQRALSTANDGAVPLASALAHSLNPTRQHPPYDYDHTRLAFGYDDFTVTDPELLYNDLLHDICAVIGCVHVMPRSVSVAIGATQTAAATLAGVPANTQVQWRTVDAGHALLTGGSATSITISGAAQGTDSLIASIQLGPAGLPFEDTIPVTVTPGVATCTQNQYSSACPPPGQSSFVQQPNGSYLMIVTMNFTQGGAWTGWLSSLEYDYGNGFQLQYYHGCNGGYYNPPADVILPVFFYFPTKPQGVIRARATAAACANGFQYAPAGGGQYVY